MTINTNIHKELEDVKQKLNEQLSTTVSVALFGQPGAGKSSLINAIIGKKVAEPGVETDKTVREASYKHNGLNFVDLPGYGTKNFPKESYFDKFNIKDFDLFLCVTSGKLHQADTELFRELNNRGKVCIFVANKHDDMWEDGFSIEELEKRKKADIEKNTGKEIRIVFTSCRNKTGLDALNDEIKENLDAAKKERWERGAKAYSLQSLNEKKAACERVVGISAAAASLNALNPIPGADIAVDVGILIKLFSDIREGYGLDEAELKALLTTDASTTAIATMVNNIIKFGAKEGLLILLKRYAGFVAAKEITKYIPFAGQAIAASLGYMITSSAGSYYLNECHALAEEIISKKLKV